MADLKDTLSAKKVDIQARFDKLEAERKELGNQRADLDRNIAIKLEELVRIQGEFRLIEELVKNKK